LRTSILVAEEDPTLAAIVTETFASGEHNVKVAATIEQAMTELEQWVPDLLLVSDGLSGGRGMELCKRVRSSRGQNEAPAILFITAQPRLTKFPGLSSCVDLWLRKPVDPTVLESAVERLLQRKRRHEPANPLTKLPCQPALDREISRRRAAGQSFSVCSFRLEPEPAHAYRRRHGEIRYTAMVKQAAHTVLGCAIALGGEEALVVHTGTADDPEFVALVETGKSGELCEAVREEFEATAELLYDAREREDGYLSLASGSGETDRIPLVTLVSKTVSETPQAQSSGSSRSQT
jgi:DNA-binding response OmpR family regulator